MKLEDQVVSLDLAKRLKELGVKQESLFYHWQFLNDELGLYKYDGVHDYRRERKRNGAYWIRICSAFTVAELGEMLPFGFYETWFLSEGIRFQFPKVDPETQYFESAKTEADARARMLIYLIEIKLVTP